ncbi:MULTISPECIES: 2Fe-2S iron-sulfur cluster-binding protein [Desulfosediminicola]|uniref:2Fe-2S iron-sulfur cluster-binding protein n=1 Tax=Desulfosediminicola TaxID=2886823 RepID=UPI0010ABDEC5|nr:2Fe-2S iron-sulfur cluster-binding protein [Desulfosediminicola ganghwensis]
MAQEQGNTRKVAIYRYDPTVGGDGHYDHYDLHIEDETNTTILDVLLRIQREQDSTLAFRYACRVNMCGSCAVVINGREGLACKTNVSDFAESKDLTIRPLNHFPVVKDLVVDMGPFFEKYEECLPFFEPRDMSEEPAIIRPDSIERRAIGFSTECIACGCCVSSCTMVNYHDGYAGPAPLNRAFTLLLDSRDALYEERLDRVLQSCYNCRTEFNCTEVCPKEISCTRSIKFIQRLAIKEPFRAKAKSKAEAAASAPAHGENVAAEPCAAHASGEAGQCGCDENLDTGRRNFLAKVTVGLGAVSALTVGGVLASTFVGQSLDKKEPVWVPAGKLGDLKEGDVTTVNLRYVENVGFYNQERVKPVMIYRNQEEDKVVVYDSRCTHLGCSVHWDARQKLFLCACHGGAFELDGSVKAGPPPRPLATLEHRVENGNILIAMV